MPSGISEGLARGYTGGVGVTQTDSGNKIYPHVLFFSNSILAPDWYLSSNGVDTSKCGLSDTCACRTLDWLLGRFYNTSYKINQTLSLVTDSSLLIDSQLLVSNIHTAKSVHTKCRKSKKCCINGRKLLAFWVYSWFELTYIMYNVLCMLCCKNQSIKFNSSQ